MTYLGTLHPENRQNVAEFDMLYPDICGRIWHALSRQTWPNLACFILTDVAEFSMLYPNRCGRIWHALS